MARTVAELPKGSRITDYIGFGVLATTFPLDKVKQILSDTGKKSIRERELPAHVVIYYVMALALYMQSSYREVLRCLLEGVQWLRGEDVNLKITGKSGISQARTRLGVEPMMRLHDELVKPIATEATRGAWYRSWRVVSIDGSCMDVADESVNAEEFGRPASKKGVSGFPQMRFVSLVENGTHVLFGTKMGSYGTSERKLAAQVIEHLQPGMLCLADRGFFGYDLWNSSHATGADLLWRVKKNLDLPILERLSDGSYLSMVFKTAKDRRHGVGTKVRVIEYQLVGITDAEPLYRLMTTILDPAKAPAQELAALYHERWEIETALDELKTHLRGARVVLRSKTPDLCRQEFYGLLMTHFAIRGLMHEAALSEDIDPDQLSFAHSVKVVRRKLPLFGAFPPSTVDGVSQANAEGNLG
ncbi:IS4 family transposase [Desulfonatronum parangueonense]